MAASSRRGINIAKMQYQVMAVAAASAKSVGENKRRNKAKIEKAIIIMAAAAKNGGGSWRAASWR